MTVRASAKATYEQRQRRALVARLVVASLGLLVGARETGTNGGALINNWQAATGNGTGDAWCLSVAVRAICAVLEAVWPGLGPKVFPLPRTGSCDEILRAGDRLGITYRLARFAGDEGVAPQVGDLVLMLNPGNPEDAVHALIVESIGTGGWFGTLEGNTNDAGSREGDGFYRKRRGGRDDKATYEIVRWVDGLLCPPILG